MEIGAGKFNCMLYSDNLGLIYNSVNKLNSLLSKINGSSILSYEMTDGGISKTVFENGVTVLSNHLSKEVSFGGKTIKPYEFFITEKGA